MQLRQRAGFEREVLPALGESTLTGITVTEVRTVVSAFVFRSSEVRWIVIFA
jgi:hypothetical protein